MANKPAHESRYLSKPQVLDQYVDGLSHCPYRQSATTPSVGYYITHEPPRYALYLPAYAGGSHIFLLIFEGSSLTHGRIQDLLADTQALWGYFQKFICIDEVQALLQAHDLRRSQL